MISHRPPLKSETFNKSQLSEPIAVPSGCVSSINDTRPFAINSELEATGSGTLRHKGSPFVIIIYKMDLPFDGVVSTSMLDTKEV